MSNDQLPMMLDDTINAFCSCVCVPPKCEKCPLFHETPEYECKESVKHSVKYWLMRARMLDDDG